MSDNAESGSVQERACPFCALLASGSDRVRRRGIVAVIPDTSPVTEGHVLIVPLRHVSDVFEITEPEWRDAFTALGEMRFVLEAEDQRIAGFNVGVNYGEVAGQTIPHAHIHLIPRRQGDTPSPRGGVRGVIPDRMDYEDGLRGG